MEKFLFLRGNLLIAAFIDRHEMSNSTAGVLTLTTFRNAAYGTVKQGPEEDDDNYEDVDSHKLVPTFPPPSNQSTENVEDPIYDLSLEENRDGKSVKRSATRSCL